MAGGAVARGTVFALRRQIAKIEGTLPERLETAAGMVRRGGAARNDGRLLTGVDRLDAALGGGLPRAALTEIHGAGTRDAGAVSGFMLGLAGLLLAARRGTAEATAPVLWIGTAEIFGETGFPYAGGLQAMFGIEPETLLFCEAKKLADALWVAEEAARLKEPAAVVIEVRGNPRQLDLTATRRLQARARAAAGGNARTDGGARSPCRRAGSVGAARNHRRSACGLHWPARLHRRHQQGQRRPIRKLHTGVEPR